MSAYKGLIVGLGNPGDKYLFTRHNFGFMLVDRLLNTLSCDLLARNKFNAEIYSCNFAKNCTFLLAKAHTFMNLSGESVQPIANFYKLSPNEIYAVHDELDLDFGIFKFKFGGGNAGHNGLKSISQCLGTNDFYRLRMGIGKSAFGNSASYVLSPFSNDEKKDLIEVLDLAIDELTLYAIHGAEEAKNMINLRKSKENNKRITLSPKLSPPDEG